MIDLELENALDFLGLRKTLDDYIDVLGQLSHLDFDKMSTENLCESLNSIKDEFFLDSFKDLLYQERCKDESLILRLRNRVSSIRKDVLSQKGHFEDTLNVRERDGYSHSLECYVTFLDRFRSEEMELRDEETKLLDSPDTPAVRQRLKQIKNSLRMFDVDYKVTLEDMRQTIDDTEYNYAKEAKKTYHRLLDLLNEVDKSIKELLEDEPSIRLLAKLREDFLFADIVDVLFGLFHDDMFRPGVTKPMVLLALNFQESPLKLVNDRAQAAAAVVIDSIARYYREDPSDLLEWEERVLSYWGLTAKSYSTHKDDADENEPEDNWVLGKKWRERITSFRQYLMDLNVFKHEHDISKEVLPE